MLVYGNGLVLTRLAREKLRALSSFPELSRRKKLFLASWMGQKFSPIFSGLSQSNHLKFDHCRTVFLSRYLYHDLCGDIGKPTYCSCSNLIKCMVFQIVRFSTQCFPLVVHNGNSTCQHFRCAELAVFIGRPRHRGRVVGVFGPL